MSRAGSLIAALVIVGLVSLVAFGDFEVEPEGSAPSFAKGGVQGFIREVVGWRHERLDPKTGAMEWEASVARAVPLGPARFRLEAPKLRYHFGPDKDGEPRPPLVIEAAGGEASVPEDAEAIFRFEGDVRADVGDLHIEPADLVVLLPPAATIPKGKHREDLVRVRSHGKLEVLRGIDREAPELRIVAHGLEGDASLEKVTFTPPVTIEADESALATAAGEAKARSAKEGAAGDRVTIRTDHAVRIEPPPAWEVLAGRLGRAFGFGGPELGDEVLLVFEGKATATWKSPDAPLPVDILGERPRLRVRLTKARMEAKSGADRPLPRERRGAAKGEKQKRSVGADDARRFLGSALVRGLEARRGDTVLARAAWLAVSGERDEAILIAAPGGEVYLHDPETRFSASAAFVRHRRTTPRLEPCCPVDAPPASPCVGDVTSRLHAEGAVRARFLYAPEIEAPRAVWGYAGFHVLEAAEVDVAFAPDPKRLRASGPGKVVTIDARPAADGPPVRLVEEDGDAGGAGATVEARALFRDARGDRTIVDGGPAPGGRARLRDGESRIEARRIVLDNGAGAATLEGAVDAFLASGLIAALAGEEDEAATRGPWRIEADRVEIVFETVAARAPEKKRERRLARFEAVRKGSPAVVTIGDPAKPEKLVRLEGARIVVDARTSRGAVEGAESAPPRITRGKDEHLTAPVVELDLASGVVELRQGVRGRFYSDPVPGFDGSGGGKDDPPVLWDFEAREADVGLDIEAEMAALGGPPEPGPEPAKREKRERLKGLVARGDVHLWTADHDARADRLEYTRAKDEVVLVGRPVRLVTQEGDGERVETADRIVLKLERKKEKKKRAGE